MEICAFTGYYYGMEKYGVVTGEEDAPLPKSDSAPPATLHDLWKIESEIALKKHLKNSMRQKGIGPSIEPSGRRPV